MRKIILLAALLLLFVSCDRQDKMPEDNIRWLDIYYEESGENLIGSEPYAFSEKDDIRTMLDKAIERMSEKPLAAKLLPVLPEGTAVVSTHFRDGLAKIELTNEYLTLRGMDKTIADSCILMTISGFLKVSRLQITVDGVPQGDGISIDEIITQNPKARAAKEEIEVYLRDDAGALTAVLLTVPLDGTVLPEQIAVQALCDAMEGYSSPLPQGSKVLSVDVHAHACRVNFSKELLGANENDAREMVSAIVRTLTSVEYIDTVRILVEGEEVSGFDSISLGREYSEEYFNKAR